MKDKSAGLLAASFIAIAPGYISRSVAGSYDNEAIAIFLLMFTFYLWIKAMKEGSAFFGTLAGLFYFYMVAAWGTVPVQCCLPSTDIFADFRWLCVYHQYDPTSRLCSHSHGPFQLPNVCGILLVVRNRYSC